MKKSLLTLTAALAALSLSARADDAVYRVIPSAADFDTTVAKLSSAIESKGMTIFAVIDHKAAAGKVELDMQPATVIIFGAPKAGTPLMRKDPRLALQLPLKVLVTEGEQGVQIVFTPTARVIEGSSITADEVADTLAKAETLLENAVKE